MRVAFMWFHINENYSHKSKDLEHRSEFIQMHDVLERISLKLFDFKDKDTRQNKAYLFKVVYFKNKDTRQNKAYLFKVVYFEDKDTR